MRCTRYKLILLSTFLLLLKPLFSFSIGHFSVDSDYQRINYSEGSSFRGNGSNSVRPESNNESLNRASDPLGLGESQKLNSLRDKSGISLGLVNNGKLVPVNAGFPIVFNKTLAPARGSVTQYNGSTIQLSSPGHYFVSWGFGLKIPPANPEKFIQMALQTSSTPNGEYTTYNKYANLLQNSSPVVSMKITVKITKTTYIQVKNISKIPAELGLSDSSANYPMAYIDVVQID